MGIDVPALFNGKGIYQHWHGVNVTAVVWCFLGGGVCYLLPIGALPAVMVPLITGAVYLLTMRWRERFHRVRKSRNWTKNTYLRGQRGPGESLEPLISSHQG